MKIFLWTKKFFNLKKENVIRIKIFVNEVYLYAKSFLTMVNI